MEEDFDCFVNLPNEVGNYLSKLRNEFTFTVNPISGKIAKSEQDFTKLNSNKESPNLNS